MNAPEKFRYVLREFKNKELRDGGSGSLVTDKKQALAIAFSEAQKIQPSYGRYKEGGELYATGGELMKSYKAEDYFPTGNGYEFMFDKESKADKMASAYGSKVIEDGGSFYVPLNLTKMKNGGELDKSIKSLKKSLGDIGKSARLREQKIRKALDKNKRIEIEEFKKIIGNDNPSRVKPVKVGSMTFSKCLFAPCYQLIKE